MFLLTLLLSEIKGTTLYSVSCMECQNFVSNKELCQQSDCRVDIKQQHACFFFIGVMKSWKLELLLEVHLSLQKPLKLFHLYMKDIYLHESRQAAN